MNSSPLAHIRLPPQHLESERALLGAILLRPETLYEIVDLLSSESFYADKHRRIYSAMLELFTRRDPIDLLSLTARLEEKGELAALGGRGYVGELVAAVPSAANARHYAEIVQKKYLLRKLIEAADVVANLGYEEQHELDEVLEEAEKRIFEVTNRSAHVRVTELKQLLGEAWERLDRLHNAKGELRGVPTGFRELDDKLSGLQRSDLIILAARPSMGKTSLALDIARLAATVHNVTVGIFSLEMSAQQLVDRMLAAESHVDAWKLRTGRLSTDEEFGKLRDGLDKLAKAPIFIDDQPAINVLKMRSVARRLKSERGLGLLIVDYLQLMAPTSSRAYESEVQQVTEISRSLKGLARELDVPVLALSQLSRAIESRGGRPRLSDLRSSGCLAGETLVTRADTGERVPIKNLVGAKNIPIFSLNETGKCVPTTLSKVFPSGRKKLYELTTRTGRTIRASANHPFRRLAEWARLDALKPGDAIAVPHMLANENLRQLARSDIYWDTVLSIKPLGVEEVFDATVPDTHNFVANDIFVHNSLEQDSDVVMFIHREDKYKDTTDKPNIAEIMIEKHRNGPTGKVELYFDDRKATFLSIEKSNFGPIPGAVAAADGVAADEW